MNVPKHPCEQRADDHEVLTISKHDKTTLDSLMTFLQCKQFISEKNCRLNTDRLKELSIRHIMIISALSELTEDRIMTSIRGLDDAARGIIHEAIEGHRTGRLNNHEWMAQVFIYGVRTHLTDLLWFDKPIMNKILEATE